ncbi:MAG TPA: helix-turn-helix transcriptional regulator [Sporichthyaceae bacterium]|jgi:transcriptional regulator with XRE-family HTH domain|nr:helix-turn-helix transcriptional regulator [Sporichthyaceae bacterium]
MPTRRRSEPIEEPTVNLNEVIAYNFRRARELRGLTQPEAAAVLEPFLGQRLPQASISAIERTFGGDKHREFDAQELLAFACAFDLPLLWFFLPPPGDSRRLQATSDRVNELYRLALGREDQLGVLYARFRELGMREPDEHDLAWAAVMRTPTGVMLNDYRHRRKELLLRLLDQYADRVDASADELGEFFDHLRQVGIRGLIAEQLNDPDYAVEPTSKRRKAPPKS